MKETNEEKPKTNRFNDTEGFSFEPVKPIDIGDGIILGGKKKLGDVEGHEFHGNQWGGGGASKNINISGRSVAIHYLPDDDNRLNKIDAAGIYDKANDQILIKEKYKGTHAENHEIGHAIYSHTQPADWEYAFKNNGKAWSEFLETPVARSYQTRKGSFGGNKNEPSHYDWLEAQADLYMARVNGSLSAYPELIKVMDSVAAENVQHRKG